MRIKEMGIKLCFRTKTPVFRKTKTYTHREIMIAKMSRFLVKDVETKNTISKYY